MRRLVDEYRFPGFCPEAIINPKTAVVIDTPPISAVSRLSWLFLKMITTGTVSWLAPYWIGSGISNCSAVGIKTRDIAINAGKQ